MMQTAALINKRVSNKFNASKTARIGLQTTEIWPESKDGYAGSSVMQTGRVHYSNGFCIWASVSGRVWNWPRVGFKFQQNSGVGSGRRRVLAKRKD